MEATYRPVEQQLPQIEQWRNDLEKILQYYADIPYRYGEVLTYVVVSRDRNHYMLIQFWFLSPPDVSLLKPLVLEPCRFP
jgi:hypothetical protein